MDPYTEMQGSPILPWPQRPVEDMGTRGVDVSREKLPPGHPLSRKP